MQGEVGRGFIRAILAGWALVLAGTVIALALGIMTDEGLWFQAVCAYLAVGAAAGTAVHNQCRRLVGTLPTVIAGTLIGIFINLLIDMIVSFSTLSDPGVSLMIGGDISEHVFWLRIIFQAIIAIPIGAAFGFLMCLRSTPRPHGRNR